MNKDRLLKLQQITDTLGEIADRIESVKEDEDEARENYPPSLEGSERYELSEEYSEAMESAIDLIREAIEVIEGVN